MKCRIFIPILLSPMLSISSASSEVLAPVDSSTSEISSTQISVMSVNPPLKREQPTDMLSLALKKFSKDFECAHQNSEYTNYSESQTAIWQNYKFYMSMVLMHIKYEDYVESFLNNKVSWVHIVGLSLAFNDHKQSTQAEGFTQRNSEFLMKILLLYYRQNSDLSHQMLIRHSGFLEYTSHRLSTIEEERKSLETKNRHLMEKVEELETTLKNVTAHNSNRH